MCFFSCCVCVRALAWEGGGYRIKLLGTRAALLAYSTHMQSKSNTCPHERVADKQRKAGLLFIDLWLHQFLLCRNIMLQLYLRVTVQKGTQEQHAEWNKTMRRYRGSDSLSIRYRQVYRGVSAKSGQKQAGSKTGSQAINSTLRRSVYNHTSTWDDLAMSLSASAA